MMSSLQVFWLEFYVHFLSLPFMLQQDRQTCRWSALVSEIWHCVVWYSVTIVSEEHYWRTSENRWHVPPEYLYPSTLLQGVITQKTTKWNTPFIVCIEHWNFATRISAIYLFIRSFITCCLSAMLLVAQITCYWMIGWLLKKELGKLWEELILA